MSRFLKGFSYAGRGLALCLRERNFRFHLVAVLFVTYFAVRFYELSRGEWAVLLLTYGIVLSLEAVNTAIERLADRVTTEHDSVIGVCKDISAGAVLISAIFAVGVAVALFADVERIRAVWAHFTEVWWRIPLFVAVFVGAMLAVFLPEKYIKK